MLLRLLPVDERIADLALSSSFSDLEDALHYYTTLQHRLDALVTRNRRHYRNAKLPLLTAEECVQLYREGRA